MLRNRVIPGKQELRNGLLLALALSLVFAVGAIAGNMHFNSGGGSWSSPFLFDAVIVGVGNDATFVDVRLDGTIRALCENKGGNQAPGQNAVSVSVSHEGGPFFADENGRVVIEDEVVPSPVFVPGSITPKEAGCPNGNWKVVGFVPDTEAWEQLTAFARNVEDGPILDTLIVPCFTTFEPDGTTSGVCFDPEA